RAGLSRSRLRRDVRVRLGREADPKPSAMAGASDLAPKRRVHHRGTHESRQDQGTARALRGTPAPNPGTERMSRACRGMGRAMSAEHNVDGSRTHHNWDNGREPILVVESGDIIHFDLPMTGEGQVREASTVEDVEWDFD